MESLFALRAALFCPELHRTFLDLFSLGFVVIVQYVRASQPGDNVRVRNFVQQPPVSTQL